MREFKDEISRRLVELNAVRRDESESEFGQAKDPGASAPQLADFVQGAEQLLNADRAGMAVDGEFVRQMLNFIVSMGKKGEEPTD